MKFKYILITFILLVATVFIAGCASEKIHLNIKYLYIPGDINGEKVLSELRQLSDKYPDSITLTMVSRVGGIPQEFRNLGINESVTEPVILINDKLLYRKSSEVDDLLSGRIKLPS